MWRRLREPRVNTNTSTSWMKTIVQNGMEQRQKLVHPCSLRIRIKDLVSPTQSGKFSLLQFNDRWQWGARAETELVPVIEKARVTRYNFWYKDLLPSRACVPSLSALIFRDCIWFPTASPQMRRPERPFNDLAQKAGHRPCYTTVAFMLRALCPLSPSKIGFPVIFRPALCLDI